MAERHDRVRAIEATLRRLNLVGDGIGLSLVVNEDGLAIAHYPHEALNGAMAAAVAARMTVLARQSLQRLAQGEMGRLLVEGEQGTLLCCPAGDVILALLIAREASLGHTLFAAQKAADEIAGILADD